MIRAAFILLLCALAAWASVQRHALLVGSNEGGVNLDKLRFAEEDAKRFGGVLTSLARFDAANVKILLKPDSSDLERDLRRVDTLMRSTADTKNSLFIFYYSGHADAEKLLLGEGKSYSLQRVKRFLDSIPCGIRVAVFDACNSGAITALKGGTRGQPFYYEPYDTIKGQVIIASSAAYEKAQESEALQGSVFSHHWMNGLRGSADVSGDKRITLNEAYQYAYRKTLETTALTNAGMQHPVYRFNIRGQGDIVLTDLSNRTGGVLLSGDTEGKFLISSDDYVSVFADFFKKPGRDLFISIAPGRYTALCASGDDVTMHSFTLGNDTYRLNRSLLRPLALQTARLKGATEQPVTPPAQGRPVSTYAFGIGTGAMLLRTGQPQEVDRTAAVSITNRVYLSDMTDFTFDINGYFPGVNAGFEAGFDHALMGGTIRPWLGGGAGLYFLEKSAESSSDPWGPSLTLHAGMTIALAPRLNLQVQIPFTAVIGTHVSQIVGLQARLLIGGRFRDIRVVQ